MSIRIEFQISELNIVRWRSKLNYDPNKMKIQMKRKMFDAILWRHNGGNILLNTTQLLLNTVMHLNQNFRYQMSCIKFQLSNDWQWLFLLPLLPNPLSSFLIGQLRLLVYLPSSPVPLFFLQSKSNIFHFIWFGNQIPIPIDKLRIIISRIIIISFLYISFEIWNSIPMEKLRIIIISGVPKFFCGPLFPLLSK